MVKNNTLLKDLLRLKFKLKHLYDGHGSIWDTHLFVLNNYNHSILVSLILTTLNFLALPFSYIYSL